MSAAYDWNTHIATQPFTHQGTAQREREWQKAHERVTHRAEWQEPIPGIIPPVHTPTLLEDMGCCPHDTSDEYVAAIDAYKAGKMDWKALMATIPVHKCRQCRGGN